MLAILGLIYLCEAWNLDFYDSDELFREKSPPDLGATISKNQFELLISGIKFDDSVNRK